MTTSGKMSTGEIVYAAQRATNPHATNGINICLILHCGRASRIMKARARPPPTENEELHQFEHVA